MFDRLPYELVCTVVSYLDSEDFVSTSLVCRTLNRALFELSTWTQRLDRHGIILNYEEMEEIGLDALKWTYELWRVNLLKNLNMDKGLETSEGREWKDPSYEGWERVGSFKIEKHVGCDPWPIEAGLVYHNVVTSYSAGTRRQKIQLQNKVPTILQQLKGGQKIQVHWSVWIAPRYDCGSRFTASLSWRGIDEVELEKMELSAGRKWIKLQKVVTLDGCLDGEFVYSETGSDSRFWRGYYGVKILNPKITVKIV